MIPATTIPSQANVLPTDLTLSEPTHTQPVGCSSPVRKPVKPEAHENERATTLRVLLNHHGAYHIEYDKIYKSSHYSMGLISLYVLGGTNSHLTRYACQYETRLIKLSELKKAQELETVQLKITMDNWKQHLGLKMYYENFCNFFEETLSNYEISGRNYSDLVNDFFPHLMPSIWTQALHPMIQLGWGLSLPAQPELITRRTIIEGLAYMCHSFKSCDHMTSGYQSLEGAAQNCKSALEVLAECVERWGGEEYETKVNEASQQGVYATMQLNDFNRKMDLVMTRYQDAIHQLDTMLYIDPHQLDDTIQTLTDLAYFLETCSSNNFFILHAVTGMYAIKHIIPHLKLLDDRVRAVRYAFKTMLAVYIAEGLPSHPVLTKAISYDSIHPFVDILVCQSPRLPTWSSLLARALDSTDDHSADTHSIKLVQVAWRDMQHTESAEARQLYLLCAAKRMRRTENWQWEREREWEQDTHTRIIEPPHATEQEWSLTTKEEPEEKQHSDPCPDHTHVLEHSLRAAGVRSPIISPVHETMESPSESSLAPPDPSRAASSSGSGVAASHSHSHSAVPIPLSTSLHPMSSLSLNVSMPSPAQSEQIQGLETDEYKAAHTGSQHPLFDQQTIQRQTHTQEQYISPPEYAQTHPPPISSVSLNPADCIPQSDWNVAHQGSSHPHLQHVNNQHLTR